MFLDQTTSHKPSTDRRTSEKHVPSVRMTDKKSVCGDRQYCNCSTKPFSSCVNKDAMRKVPFSRSNSIRMINAQLSKAVRKLDFYNGSTAKELEKVQNSTDRIVRQNWIEMHQSASHISSQSAMPLAGQSQPRVCTPTSQSPVSNPGSFPYKSRCRSQFVSPVFPRTENSTIDATNSASRNQFSNTPVRCQATRVNQLSNTPVRRRASPRYLSNSPVRHPQNPPDSTLTNLPWLLWINNRIQRQQLIRRRRHQRNYLMYAICAVVSLCNWPTIVATCWRTMASQGMVFLRFIRALMLGMANTSEDRGIEPDSDD